MAEIKSTLDLVMERTRHLTMSAEEKAGQQKKDFEKKLQGLQQQYEDGVLSIDEFMEHVTGLQTDLFIDDPMFVVSSVLQRIQPARDNAHWLRLIQRLAPAASIPLEHTLADYREKVAVLIRKDEQHHLESLAGDHGIRGSAVLPNLDKDARHQEALSGLDSETRARIEKSLQQAD